jgi:hypothetical protein
MRTFRVRATRPDRHFCNREANFYFRLLKEGQQLRVAEGLTSACMGFLDLRVQG